MKYRVANRGGRSPGPDALMWALAVAILCYVWRLQDLYPILASLQVPALSSATVLALYVFSGDRRRRLRDLDGSLLRLWGGLTLIVAASVPFALVQGESFAFLTGDFLTSTLLLVVLTAAAIRSEADVRWIVGVHVAGAAIFCLFVMARVSVGMGGRLGDLAYYDANGLGLLIVVCLPLTLYFFLRSRQVWTRLLAAMALLLFLVTLIKTGSRGAFIGFCVVGAWILVRYDSIPLGRRMAALAGAVLILGIWGSADYWDRMESLLTPTQDYNWAGEAESGRMEVWKRGVGYMLDHPLVGVGARNFNAAEGRLSERGRLNQLGGPGFKWSAAHNSFVQIGAETGIIGLALFIAILLQGYRIAGRSPPSVPGAEKMNDAKALRQALRVGIVGYVTAGFFLSSAYDPILYALVGLLMALEKLDHRALEARASASTTGTARGGTTAHHPVREHARRRTY